MKCWAKCCTISTRNPFQTMLPLTSVLDIKGVFWKIKQVYNSFILWSLKSFDFAVSDVLTCCHFDSLTQVVADKSQCHDLKSHNFDQQFLGWANYSLLKHNVYSMFTMFMGHRCCILLSTLLDIHIKTNWIWKNLHYLWMHHKIPLSHLERLFIRLVNELK